MFRLYFNVLIVIVVVFGIFGIVIPDLISRPSHFAVLAALLLIAVFSPAVLILGWITLKGIRSKLSERGKSGEVDKD